MHRSSSCGGEAFVSEADFCSEYIVQYVLVSVYLTLLNLLYPFLQRRLI